MLPPHRCCCATLASLLLCMPVPFLPCCCCAWRSRITAAVPLLRCCCCAALTSLLPYRSRVAPAACGALASPLLWHSRSHRCCCGALASLLLCRSRLAAACGAWRSRIAAAVPLSPRCGCGVLPLIRPLLLLYMVLSHRCCLATLTWLAGAVARSYRCCRALAHRCCRAPLASRPPCETYIAATAPLSHDCCCGALAPPLLLVWRSCIAAAVALARVAAAVRLLHS